MSSLQEEHVGSKNDMEGVKKTIKIHLLPKFIRSYICNGLILYFSTTGSIVGFQIKFIYKLRSEMNAIINVYAQLPSMTDPTNIVACVLFHLPGVNFPSQEELVDNFHLIYVWISFACYIYRKLHDLSKSRASELTSLGFEMESSCLRFVYWAHKMKTNQEHQGRRQSLKKH